ncbi:hypothetical protein J6590_046795 [Homalodisca vitripennis]|nr:hypothetical protein J6590_046795 [Homalodisca vitripennis]
MFPRKKRGPALNQPVQSKQAGGGWKQGEGYVESPDENLAESRLVPVVVRRVRQAPAAEEEEYEDEDQDTAATGDNEVSQAEDDAVDSDSAESETNEDDPRNKRFLNLGGSGGSGGSGGGSGNFLFDIIRVSAAIN